MRIVICLSLFFVQQSRSDDGGGGGNSLQNNLEQGGSGARLDEMGDDKCARKSCTYGILSKYLITAIQVLGFVVCYTWPSLPICHVP